MTATGVSLMLLTTSTKLAVDFSPPGSVAVMVTVVVEWLGQDGNVLTVSSAGRDENLGFAMYQVQNGTYVEVK